MNPLLCIKFQELASRTWNRLRITTDPNINTTLSETSITDDILLELAMLGSPNIDLYKTPHNEERNKGTDWEFWIGRDSEWIRYAIQAKKIDLKTGKYTQLRHKVGKRLQLEILKDYADINQAVPLYCFYNYVKDGAAKRLHHRFFCRCRCFPYHHEDALSQLGITVTPLNVVESIMPSGRARDRTFDWIHQQTGTHPWSCLVCCDWSCLDIWGDEEPKIYKSPPRFSKKEKSGAGRIPLISEESISSSELYSKEVGMPKNIAIINLSPSD